MGVKLYKILTLEQALKEGKLQLFPMGEDEYSETVVRDRTQFIWIAKRMYDAGLEIAMVVGEE